MRDGSKTFCSPLCHKKYLALHSEKCQLESCDKRFLKSIGAYVHGKWFCCDDHADNDPQTKEVTEMLAKGIDFYNEQGD